MSDLVYQDDLHIILANDKGVQIGRKEGRLKWVQYDSFFEQCEKVDELEKQNKELISIVEQFIKSAHPHPALHPSMWAAQNRGIKYLEKYKGESDE